MLLNLSALGVALEILIAFFSPSKISAPTLSQLPTNTRKPGGAPTFPSSADMGGKRNRSRAMVLAAKRRAPGDVPRAPAPDLTGGFPFESPANERKTRFGDDDGDSDDDGDAEEGTKGYQSLVPVPPPPGYMHVPITSPHTVPATHPPRPTQRVTHFERYYRSQRLVTDDFEWNAFFSHLKKPLPVTFRLSQMASHLGGVEEALWEGQDVLSYSGVNVRTDAGRVVQAPRKLHWCDGFQLGCDKNALKFSHNETLRKTQKWLVKHNSTGVLTRQAVDSMVPAAILGIEPGHTVLDLCASPGSKTTQALELVERGDTQSNGGCVVANDISPMRCYHLVRRCAALGSATKSLMITNHHAQWFPNPAVALGGGNKSEENQRYPSGCFDRVLCDVPCSGDGTLRKNPQIWNEWRPEFAVGLHTLQLRIAMRGAALLKIGGYMVYSTCSFNPIENEAVVAALIEKCGGALEIVDASDRFLDLKRRPGMAAWKVITMEDDHLTEWKDYDETQSSSEDSSKNKNLSEGLKKAFKPSMWAPTASGVTKLGKRIKGPPLEWCLRLVPHDQDMGGFFATLLRKVGEIPGPKGSSNVEEKNSSASKNKEEIVQPPKPKSQCETKHEYTHARGDVLRSFSDAWGVAGDAFDTRIAPNLFTRDEGVTPKTLTYLSPGAKTICSTASGASRLKCVWGGAIVFERRGSGVGERAPRKDNSKITQQKPMTPEQFVETYRLMQDGARVLFSAGGIMGSSARVIPMPSRDVEKLLSNFNSEVPLKQLTPSSRTACESLSSGSIIVVLKGADESVCPPLAVELDTINKTLKIEWRYRRGLEGAPKATVAAMLRKVVESRESRA